MNEGGHNAESWLQSLRRMGDSLLRLAQRRFELFAVELQEQKLRALKLLVTKLPGLKSASLALRINRILVPVDFSARTKSAVQFASGLARAMHARLALVHVVAPLPTSSSRFRTEFNQHADETDLDAGNKLSALAATVPSGIKVEVMLSQDIPQRGIVAAAKKWRSDLILLPTRGLSGVKYILVGSSAEAVLRHAPCPVLTLGGNPPNDGPH